MNYRAYIRTRILHSLSSIIIYSPETSNDYSYSGSESMWLKIISQWVFFAMYWKALQVAYVENTS